MKATAVARRTVDGLNFMSGLGRYQVPVSARSSVNSLLNRKLPLRFRSFSLAARDYAFFLDRKTLTSTTRGRGSKAM